VRVRAIPNLIDRVDLRELSGGYSKPDNANFLGVLLQIPQAPGSGGKYPGHSVPVNFDSPQEIYFGQCGEDRRPEVDSAWPVAVSGCQRAEKSQHERAGRMRQHPTGTRHNVTDKE